ncbi:MAG: glycosyltransferase family 2 protein [Sedimentisphaerales bacterium]|nr:glycosyltransferase family 2 protein [Sedimentisphaerales bacterium]
MNFYDYVALAAIVSQMVFLYQIAANYRFAIKKTGRHRRGRYCPRTALIVPCKGLDVAFETNITSFYRQDYDNHVLWFVVADTDDPAYGELCRLREKLIATTRAQEVRIFVAGIARSCSQKNHNLLYCYRQLPADIAVMAFVDSDACIRDNWLASIVYPLRKDKVGVASGYRWFVPQKNNSATLALSVINGAIAQLLGANRSNQAWGGSMAVHIELFRRLGIERLWANSITDDLSLSYAVRKAGKRITFVPACLVASHEQTTWRDFFSFARRQFLLTRVAAPGTWWFGLFGGCYSTIGLYGGGAVAVYAYCVANAHWIFFAAVPAVFFAGHLCRSILRQLLIVKLLPEQKAAMKAARRTDIAVGWLLSPVLLATIVSSAFGRRIRWRGITYKLISPTETLVET